MSQRSVRQTTAKLTFAEVRRLAARLDIVENKLDLAMEVLAEVLTTTSCSRTREKLKALFRELYDGDGDE